MIENINTKLKKLLTPAGNSLLHFPSLFFTLVSVSLRKLNWTLSSFLTDCKTFCGGGEVVGNWCLKPPPIFTECYFFNSLRNIASFTSSTLSIFSVFHWVSLIFEAEMLSPKELALRCWAMRLCSGCLRSPMYRSIHSFLHHITLLMPGCFVLRVDHAPSVCCQV